VPQSVLAVVSVLGKDQKGVVAQFATYMAERGINIQDIEQRVVRGIFVMDMLVDLKDLTCDLSELITGLLDLGRRMLAVLCRSYQPEREIVSVEQPFSVPLIDPDTGEVLERDLVGTWDLLERDAEGFVVVDLKTSGRKYSDLQVEASLQLSIYTYAVGLSPLADGRSVRLRFDVLTKTKEPELHRHWTTRDRRANVRLFRVAAEVLQAIEAGVFYPNVGWGCKDCVYRSQCWAWK
jgi:predicted amino acid-binding ACT domain protein/CRISPR/Cas system-associated exonuclease Cas4 (RecB family)